MNATDKARELGAEHGRRDAEVFSARYPRSAARSALSGRGLPEPDLSGEQVAKAIGHYVADGDVDQRYALRESYRAAYREAVETTVRDRAS